MAQLLLVRNEVKIIDSISSSDDSVNNRIADIANGSLSQLVAQIQDSPCRISLHYDETTNIKSISQLVAYVRFVKENAIVDEFLFCQEMKEKTKAKEVFDLVNTSFTGNFLHLVLRRGRFRPRTCFANCLFLPLVFELLVCCIAMIMHNKMILLLKDTFCTKYKSI